MSYILERTKENLSYILDKGYFYWFINGLKWWWDIKTKLSEIYSKKEEIDDLLILIKDNEAKLKELTFNLAKLEEEKNNKIVEIKNKEDELLRIKEEFSKAKIYNENNLEKLWKLNWKVDELKNKLKDLTNEKNNLDIEKERILTENKASKELVSKLENKINSLEKNLEQANKIKVEYETKNTQLEIINKSNNEELKDRNQFENKLRNELNEEKVKNYTEYKKLMQDANNFYNSWQELKKQYELKLEEEKQKELNKWKNIHSIHEKNTEDYFKEHFAWDISMKLNFTWYKINWEDLKPDVSVEYLYWDNKYLILFDAKTSRNSPDFSIDDFDSIQDNKEFSWKINSYIRDERKKIEKYTALKKLEWVKLYNTFYLVIPDEYLTFVDNKLLAWKFWNYNVEVISLSSSKTVLTYIIKKIEEFEYIENFYWVEDKEIESLNKYLVDVTKTAIFSSNINFQLWKFGVNIADRYEWLHENIKRKVSSEATTFKWKLSLDVWSDSLNQNLSEFLPKAKEIYEKNEKDMYKKLIS